jgi:hypothetical protein
MTTQTAQIPEKKPTPPLTFVCRGRIDTQRNHDGKFYTRVTTPAQDEYSMPSVLELRSKSQQGQVGDTLTVRCVLSGYAKPYRYLTDGIQQNGFNSNTFSDVVE